MVGRTLQTHVHVVDAVGGRPGEAVLEAPPSTEIDPDPLPKRHGSPSARPRPGIAKRCCSSSAAGAFA